MSQPQPAPHHPARCKKSSMGIMIVIIVVVVVLTVGLGGYAAYRFYSTFHLPPPTPPITNTNTIDISGNSLIETIPISTNSTVNMSCNYCNITIQMSSSNVKSDLDISGNFNRVASIGGETNILVTGNYNVVNALRTDVLRFQNSISGNVIER